MSLPHGYRSKLITVMKNSPPPADVTATIATTARQLPVVVGSAAAAPRTLRELLGRAFLMRRSNAWNHEGSAVLGLPARADAAGIDTRHVPDFTTKMVGLTTTTIGAFASLRTFAEIVGCADDSLVMIRMHLSLGNARLTYIKNNALHAMPLDTYVPDPTMLPVAIEIPNRVPNAGPVGIAARRTTTPDGTEIAVVTALRITQKHRFEDVRVLVAHGAIVKRAEPAEAVIDRQRFGLAVLDDVARMSAYAIPAISVRNTAAAQTVAPLALEALRESVRIAKPYDEAPRYSTRHALKGRAA